MVKLPLEVGRGSAGCQWKDYYQGNSGSPSLDLAAFNPPPKNGVLVVSFKGEGDIATPAPAGLDAASLSTEIENEWKLRMGFENGLNHFA